MSRSLVRAAFAAGLMCIVFSTAEATSLAQPLIDTGISSTFDPSDPDLLIVRERYYDSPGIDLTPYGIGTGSDDFVQSVYFRLYPHTSVGVESSVTGTVTFPASVKILGFITSSSLLGSSTAGSPYIQSDALFAVGADPNSYVAPSRGFEVPGSGTGSAEFIRQIDDHSFYFGLNVLGVGADDFRVIIDYGNSFTPGLTFQVHLFEDKVGNVAGSRGIVVGNAGGTPGEGDFGEILHLVDEPLTTDDPPTATVAPPATGRTLIYTVRETAGNPEVDAIDLHTGAAIPGLVTVPSPFAQPPRAIVFAEDGLLYVLGNQTGLAAIDTASGAVTNIGIPDLAGVNVRMAAVHGDTRLFILRQDSYPNPEDAWIDTYDTATGVFTQAFATFPTNLLPFPVDLIATSAGRLFALGQGDAFHEVNIVTGDITPFAFHIPNLGGDNVRGTADPLSNLVYLLRDTSADTFVDVLDTGTGQFTAGLFDLPASVIPDVGAFALDNSNILWIFSKNGGVMVVDPAAPAAPPIYQTTQLDFPGTTNYAAVRRVPGEVSPGASPRQLVVDLSPAPGSIRLSWEDLADPGVTYNIYAGAIGSYYSHASAACHLPPATVLPGYLYADLPMPGDSVYYLVTASSRVAEGSAGSGTTGPRPVAAVPPACGATP